MGTLLMPNHLYKAVTDYTQELGLEPSLYWQDPAQAQPQEPKPDPNMMALQLTQQIEGQKAEVASQRNQVEMAKVQSNERLRVAELQGKQQEAMLRGAVERARVEAAQIKGQLDLASGQQKMALERVKAASDQRLAEAEMTLDAHKTEQEAVMDKYQTDQNNATKLLVEQMKQQHEEAMLVANATIAELQAGQADMRHEAMEREEARREPLEVERDDAGIAIRVGGRPIERDERGLVRRIG